MTSSPVDSGTAVVAAAKVATPVVAAAKVTTEPTFK